MLSISFILENTWNFWRLNFSENILSAVSFFLSAKNLKISSKSIIMRKLYHDQRSDLGSQPQTKECWFLRHTTRWSAKYPFLTSKLTLFSRPMSNSFFLQIFLFSDYTHWTWLRSLVNCIHECKSYLQACNFTLRGHWPSRLWIRPCHEFWNSQSCLKYGLRWWKCSDKQLGVSWITYAPNNRSECCNK